MIQDEISQIEEFIIRNQIASEEVVKLVTDVAGRSLNTLNDVLFVKTGYRYMQQIYESEPVFYDYSMFGVGYFDEPEDDSDEMDE